MPIMAFEEIKSLYELTEENYKLQDMIQIYQEEIVKLEQEKDVLKAEVVFLRQQLEYKTLGPPIHSQDIKKDPR